MQTAPTPIDAAASTAAPAHVFAICTLVTNVPEYEQCVASFRDKGFNETNSRFVWIDNTAGNRFDGYSGIGEFVRSSGAKYTIVCHQDVELVEDGFAALAARLSELDREDPLWAVAGNSGLRGLTRMAMRIIDPWIEDAHIGDLPMRVDSLDENFLVIKTQSLLTPSADLHGFHFYGMDLCLQARLRGYTAYVIDFNLRHKSAGKRSPAFYEARAALERKYAGLVAGRIARTPCDLLFLGWCVHIRFLRWPLRRVLNVLGKLGLIDAI